MKYCILTMLLLVALISCKKDGNTGNNNGNNNTNSPERSFTISSGFTFNCLFSYVPWSADSIFVMISDNEHFIVDAYHGNTGVRFAIYEYQSKADSFELWANNNESLAYSNAQISNAPIVDGKIVIREITNDRIRGIFTGYDSSEIKDGIFDIPLHK